MAWRIRACAVTFLYHIHCVNSDLRCHYIIDGYDVFLSLRRAKFYPWTMYTYNLWIYFPFPFISTLWRHFSYLFPLSPRCILPCLLLSPRWNWLFIPISMFESIYSWFDLNLPTFPTRSLVEGGPIWRVSTCFYLIVTSRNFANRSPCRALVKNMRAYVLCYSTKWTFFCFQTCP